MTIQQYVQLSVTVSVGGHVFNVREVLSKADFVTEFDKLMERAIRLIKEHE